MSQMEPAADQRRRRIGGEEDYPREQSSRELCVQRLSRSTPNKKWEGGVCGGSFGSQNECTMDRETGINRVECRQRGSGMTEKETTSAKHRMGIAYLVWLGVCEIGSEGECVRERVRVFACVSAQRGVYMRSFSCGLLFASYLSNHIKEIFWTYSDGHLVDVGELWRSHNLEGGNNVYCAMDFYAK